MNILFITETFVPDSDVFDRDIKLRGNLCKGVALSNSVSKSAKLIGTPSRLLGF